MIARATAATALALLLALDYDHIITTLIGG